MDNLRKLLSTTSVSGCEYNGSKIIEELFLKSGAEVFFDKCLCGKKQGWKI